jgi:hypothetical protein
VVSRGDAARLLALAAAFDRRTVGEEDAVAWADVLADLDAEDCAKAIRDHYRDQTAWIMPAHIRTAVRRARAERITRDPEPVPDADPDDVPAYLAALRAGRRRQARAERARPVAALLASTAHRRSMPD